MLTVAFCTLQSLDRNVKPAAVLFKLLDNLVNVHAGMLTLAVSFLYCYARQTREDSTQYPLAKSLRH